MNDQTTYFCADCDESTLLREVDDKSASYFETLRIKWVCANCGGTNWKTIIDSPNGEPKE